MITEVPELAQSILNPKCAGQIMTLYPVTVTVCDSLEHVANMLTSRDISGLPVVDLHDRAIGVISKSDLLKRCSCGEVADDPGYLVELVRGRPGLNNKGANAAICVHDVMTIDPVTVRPDTPLAEVGRLMVHRRVHRVIVVDENAFPVGIITTLDLINALI